jgi:hypothetical protein
MLHLQKYSGSLMLKRWLVVLAFRRLELAHTGPLSLPGCRRRRHSAQAATQAVASTKAAAKPIPMAALLSSGGGRPLPVRRRKASRQMHIHADAHTFGYWMRLGHDRLWQSDIILSGTQLRPAGKSNFVVV